MYKNIFKHVINLIGIVLLCLFSNISLALGFNDPDDPNVISFILPSLPTVVTIPANPIEGDDIYLALFNQEGHGCGPGKHETSMVNNVIYIDFQPLPPDTICTAAITPWKIIVRPALKLPEGVYQVMVRQNGKTRMQHGFVVNKPQSQRVDIATVPSSSPDNTAAFSISGLYPNSCVPESKANTSIVDNLIRIDFPEIPPDAICTQSVTPWATLVSVRKPPAGFYGIEVTRGTEKLARHWLIVEFPAVYLVTFDDAEHKASAFSQLPTGVSILHDWPSLTTMAAFTVSSSEALAKLRSLPGVKYIHENTALHHHAATPAPNQPETPTVEGSQNNPAPENNTDATIITPIYNKNNSELPNNVKTAGSSPLINMNKGICKNLTAKRQKTIQRPSKSFKCEDTGLIIRSGDKIQQIMFGRVR